MAGKAKSLTILQWKLLRWLAKPYQEGSYPCMTLRHGLFAYAYPSRDFTTDTFRAAAAIHARGWFDVDEFGNHRLNQAGLAAAGSETEPPWVPPKLSPIKERDTEVLRALAAMTSGRYAGYWITSLNCGGHNGSHHSMSLKILVQHGLAIGRKRGSTRVITAQIVDEPPRLTKRAKGSLEYQITEKGLAMAEANVHADVAG